MVKVRYDDLQVIVSMIWHLICIGNIKIEAWRADEQSDRLFLLFLSA